MQDGRCTGFFHLPGAGQLGLYAITTNRPLYDPIKDLQPITVVAVTCYAIAVHPSVPAQNLRELVAYAKATRASYLTVPLASAL